MCAKKQEVALSRQQLGRAVLEYVTAHNLVEAGAFKAIVLIEADSDPRQKIELTFEGTAVEGPAISLKTDGV